MTLEDAGEVGTQSRMGNPGIRLNLFVASVTQDQFDDFPVRGREFEFNGNHFSFLAGQGQGESILCGHGRIPEKKERRTKDAPGTPAKGHTERAKADAPCGARAQDTASV